MERQAVLLLLFLLVAAVSFSTVSSQDVVHNRQLSFRNFELEESYRLLSLSSMNVTTLVDSYTDCAMSCLHVPWCISYNFGKTPDQDGKHICEALSVDKYNSSKEFLASEKFEHFSMASPCFKRPCRNRGKCIALYDKNDFKCVCPIDFEGRHCEKKVRSTCKGYFDIDKATENKAYSLVVDSGKFQVYCHMTDIPECGGGGWTLVMKIDGSKETFGYDTSYWSDKNTHNLAGGMTGLDNEETKLPTYWNTSFTKICLGMKVEPTTRYILLPREASSLYSLIADGMYRATSLSRTTWRSLIPGSSLQANCDMEGFNAAQSSVGSKARIGFIANNENNCDSADSVIGFGKGTYPYGNNMAGNSALYYADNGNKNIAAMGYILVQ